MVRFYICDMLFKILCILILLSFNNILGYVIRDEGCKIDVNKDLTYQHPLILQEKVNEFILPNTKNGITLKTGSILRLVCAGNSNHLSAKNVAEVTATCVNNNTFSVNNNIGEKTFKELRCVNYPDAVAKRTGKQCSKVFMEIQIGFETRLGFLPIITTCFDDKNKDSLYSYYQLTKQIKNSQFSVPRPNGFDAGDFYNELNPKPATIYERKSQRVAFERLLGSAELAEKYISLKSDYFLSRGHLTAKADFVYGSQQRATFFYVNVAPQWHTLNKNNWNDLEISTRNYAKNKFKDLVVYTGIFGNMHLLDKNNNNQNMSLFVNNNKKAINIPKVFWKIVHDPVAKSGTVFVSHNNPYELNVKPICKDVSNQINWVKWDAKNTTTGFSYCCNFQEFKNIVNFVPDLPILNLLL